VAWDHFFAPGGPWERSGGRRKTRVHARAFCSRVTFSRAEPFSLLDFGCALGEGLRVFHRRYPLAELHGLDISPLAIARAREHCRHFATFAVGGIEAVAREYEVIYAAHVVEHFADYHTLARQLLRKCRRLCVVVPFAQTIDGQPLQPDPSRQHQHSFFQDSFDFLVDEGEADLAGVHIVSRAGARVWRKALFRPMTNTVRRLAGKPPRDLSIIYDLVSRGAGSR
jgi:hypothetical protein